MEELRISKFVVNLTQGKHCPPDGLVVRCRVPVTLCLPWPAPYKTTTQCRLPEGAWDDVMHYSCTMAEPLRVLLPEGCRKVKVKVQQGARTLATFKPSTRDTMCTTVRPNLGRLHYHLGLEEHDSQGDEQGATLGGQSVGNDATPAGQSVEGNATPGGQSVGNDATPAGQSVEGNATPGGQSVGDDATPAGQSVEGNATPGGQSVGDDATPAGQSVHSLTVTSNISAQQATLHEPKVLVTRTKEVDLDKAEEKGLDFLPPQGSHLPLVHGVVNEAAPAAPTTGKMTARQRRRARRRAAATALKASTESEAASKLKESCVVTQDEAAINSEARPPCAETNSPASNSDEPPPPDATHNGTNATRKRRAGKRRGGRRARTAKIKSEAQLAATTEVADAQRHH